MIKPKILRTPTPDDVSDLLEIYEDMIEVIFKKHADKTDVAAPTMIYILGMCIRTREELDAAIRELNRVFEAQEKERNKND